MLQKTNVAGLSKDPETNLVINNNLSEYEIYKQNKLKAKQMLSQQQQIDRLKAELVEIRQMFQAVLDRTQDVKST